MEMKVQKCFPGWKIVRRIGEGSFGAVYEIEKEDSFQTVAHSALKRISVPETKAEIKAYRDDGYDEASITALFKSRAEDITAEFALMSKLKGHSNIVSYEDHIVVQHDDDPGYDILIRMELLTPLPDYIHKRFPDGQIPDKTAVELGIDICRALERCGRHNIIHRDIKPQNIFVNKDGDFKLGDFGIARTIDHTTSATKTGTYTYMAPEVYSTRPYNASVDQYSLGLVLYWMMNERKGPFLPLPPAVPTASQNAAALERRMKGEPLPAPKHGSEELKRIILKACAPDPRDRYAGPSDMRRDLERLSFNGVPVEGPTAPFADDTPASSFQGEPTVDLFNTTPVEADQPPQAEADATVSLFGAGRKAAATDRKPLPDKPKPVAEETVPPVKEEPVSSDRKGKKLLRILLPIAAAFTVVVIVLIFALGGKKGSDPAPQVAEEQTSTPTPTPTPIFVPTPTATLASTDKATQSKVFNIYGWGVAFKEFFNTPTPTPTPITKSTPKSTPVSMLLVEGKLQAGLYVSDAGTVSLYLYEEGVGVLNCLEYGVYYANGVVWTADSLEIERAATSYALAENVLSFTYGSSALALRYMGKSEEFALGEPEGTAFAGAYEAEDGRKLSLAADGQGVYTDAAGKQPVFWGCFKPFYDGPESDCFILYGSYLGGMTFEDGQVLLGTETEESITFTVSSSSARLLDLSSTALANRKTIATSGDHAVGIKANGTVVAVGDNEYGQCNVSRWRNIVSVAAGAHHTVGMKADGTVVAVGDNKYGQCDVSGWRNIVSISAGGDCTVGLKADGTAVVVGGYDQYDVSEWKNIVSIATTNEFVAGLKADGTLVIAGYPDGCDDSVICSIIDIAAIAGGEWNIVVLKSDGTVISQGPEGTDDYYILSMRDAKAIDAGYAIVYGLKADGTVEIDGWLTDMIDVSDWKDIVAIAGAGESVVGLKADGTVVVNQPDWRDAWDMSAWTNIRLPEE